MVNKLAKLKPFAFSVEFNDHHVYFDDIESYYDRDDFINEEEYQKAKESGEVFQGRIYPNNSVGFYVVCASDYDKVINALYDIMVQEGETK